MTIITKREGKPVKSLLDQVVENFNIFLPKSGRHKKMDEGLIELFVNLKPIGISKKDTNTT